MRARHRRALAAVAALWLAALGSLACGGAPASNQAESPPGSPSEAIFTDVTEESGVRFVHFNAASEWRYLPETMGSGVALFDFDGDDLPDLYLVNGGWPPGVPRTGDDAVLPAPTGALYRNLGDGRFADVTASSGLAVPFAGMGAAVGDYDNDGWLDLFITAVGGDRLFRNRGYGAFVEVTAAVGLEHGGGSTGFGTGFGSGAAFLDADGDGWLDLVSGRYVAWSAAEDVECSPDGVHRTYCTPEVYPGSSNRLLRNVAGRVFEDVTEGAGLLRPDGKTLGIAVLDHDGDGWPDLAVANDTARNFLFVNRRDGTFGEEAVAAGFAFSPSGATRGGMGVAAGDLSGDGRTDLVVGNFSQEMAAYYRATGSAADSGPPGIRSGTQYSDDAAQAGLGLPTLMTLAFGTLVFDYDGDGDLDVMFANGHIEPQIAETRGLQTYAQRPQLFHNEGGSFREVRGPAGSALETPYVGRGLASADLDGDGDLDLVLTQNGRPARVLRNDSPPHSWLRLRLVGGRSNRTGYGARVTAVAGDRRWVRTLASGGSYLSASEPVLTLGLGDLARLDRIEIRWPSGRVQTLPDPPLDRLLVVEEP